MAKRKSAAKIHITYHKDGSVWARGPKCDDVMTGYWEWFRKDGTKLRSGYFENGEQTGEWITYDAKGKPHKTTQMKPKSAAIGKPQRSSKKSAKPAVPKTIGRKTR